MAKHELRPYQSEALENSKAALLRGVTRQLIHLPTGTGKTIIFAQLRETHGFEGRVLVLAHRKELIEQACRKIAAQTGLAYRLDGGDIGVDMGTKSSWVGNRFVVASVQSLALDEGRRLESGAFPPRDFDLIICDEAHHATAKSYRRIFNHFGLFEPGNRTLLVGLTATPSRADGVALGNVFQEMVYTKDLLPCIKEGWLCDLRAYRIRTTVSLDPVSTIRRSSENESEFEEGELGRAINVKPRNELIVEKWIELARGRQTVAFCATIDHAKALASEFVAAKVMCEAVWGDDPRRDEKLENHRNGKITVLTNCNILTEGYDDWNIQCVLLARPTLSAGFFAQMVGRGTRIEPGISNLVETLEAGHPVRKAECLVIDVVDVTSKHKLMRVPSLLGSAVDYDPCDALSTQAVKLQTGGAAPTSHQPNPFTLGVTTEEIDLFAAPWTPDVLRSYCLQWIRRNNEWLCSLPCGGQICLREKNGSWTVKGTVQGQSFGDEKPDLAEATKYLGRMLPYLSRDGRKLHGKETGGASTLTTPCPECLVPLRKPELQTNNPLQGRVLAGTRLPDRDDAGDSDCGSGDAFPQSFRWADPLLRLNVIRWYSTGEGAFEIPLPDMGYLRVEESDGTWLSTGECDGIRITTRKHETAEEAARSLENVLRCRCDNLFELLEQETNWRSELITPFVTALYKNLGVPIPDGLQRYPAQVAILELYRFKLNPLLDEQPLDESIRSDDYEY